MNPRLALTLFVLTAMARSVTADYVTWNVVDLKGDPYSKTVVRFTPIRGWVADGTNTVVDVARSATPSATGGGRTKVLGGVYKVTADGAPGSTLIAVPGDGGEYTLNQCAQFATNCPPFFFTNFFGRISERVKVSGEGVSIVTNNQGAWNEYLSLVVTASGGPTNGITSLQATHIAVSIASDTNTALLTTINSASNAVISTVITNYVDTSAGLDVAKRISDRLVANTNVYKVLLFGDSLTDWTIGGPSVGIAKHLVRLYGLAGSSGFSDTLIATSAGVNPASVNNVAGTNWWGAWHTGTNGTVIRWDTSAGNNATRIGLYWIGWPGGGDFNLQVSTNGGSYATLATLSGYSATRTGQYTNWTVPLGRYRIQAATTTGTNIFIGGEMYDTGTNGIVPFYVFKGGANLSHFTRTEQQVWDSVLTNFSPDLILYCMAEAGDLGETLAEYHLTNSFIPWVAKSTNSVLWLTGEAHRGDEYDYLHVSDNQILRRTALKYGAIYTDGMFDGQSFARQQALGYMHDHIHYSAAGGLALGWSAMRKGGLDVSVRTPVIIATNDPSASITNGYVKVAKFSVGYGTNNHPTASIYAQTTGGEEKMLIASPGLGYFGLWIGATASAPDFNNFTLIGGANSTNVNLTTGTTVLNVKQGGALGLAIGNVDTLWFRTNNQVHIRGALSVGTTVNATNGFYGSGAGITNLPLSGVTGLPAALAWLTNNTGSSTGAVSSVNGFTGAVTLGAAAVGAEPALGFSPQPATANGTNWSSISTNVITDLRQEIADTTLDFVPQYGTANGTNWAAVDPADWRESKATKTLVVDAEHGSDVSGARGRADKPYASLTAASVASAPGDVILIRPGSNYVASSVWLKTNVTVRGYGPASKIYGDAAQTNQAVLAVTNSGVTLEDVWVSAAGTAIGYIGTTGNLAFATNVTLRNVQADGGLYGVAWAGDYLGDGNGHSMTLLMESCVVDAPTNGIGVRILGQTNATTVRMVNCNVTGAWDAVVLGGCVAVIEGGRYIATQIDGITTGNFADVTVRNAYVRGGPSANFDLFNDGYPTSILREDGVDYRTPEVGGDGWDRITHVSRQGVQAGEVRTGSLVVSNGIAATNLTGTIDAARLPVAVTNAIWGGINLSNPAVNAIYILSITTNTTLGNFGNMHASEFRTAQLWVTNGGGSTYTLTLPAGTSCPDGTTLYVTNGQRRCVSIGGLINFTNAISRALP